MASDDSGPKPSLRCPFICHLTRAPSHCSHHYLLFFFLFPTGGGLLQMEMCVRIASININLLLLLLLLLLKAIPYLVIRLTSNCFSSSRISVTGIDQRYFNAD